MMLESFLKLGIVVKRCFFPWSKLKKRKGLLITGNQFTSKRHAMKYLSCMTRFTAFLKLAKLKQKRKKNSHTYLQSYLRVHFNDLCFKYL